MFQLSLFTPVKFHDADEHQFYLEDLRMDYRSGYITELDKPAGMPLEFWYRYVIKTDKAMHV